MTKLKTISILLLIIFIPILSDATDFVSKGYIINKDSIRIDGYIKFFKFNTTPDKIYFCEESFGDYKIFEPENLREFGYEDQKFVSAPVDIEISSESTNNLTFDSDFVLIHKQVFLEVLYQGPKNLLIYRSTKSPQKNLYYIGNIDEPMLLKRKIYLVQDNDKKYKKENAAYKIQIIDYLNLPIDYLTTKRAIEYNLHCFNALFSGYYSKNSEQPYYTTTFRNEKTPWFAVAGIGFNIYHDYKDEYNSSYVDRKWAPQLGFGYSTSNLNHLWNTKIELLYSGKLSYETYHLDKINDNKYTEYFDTAKYHIFTINYYFHAPFRTKFGEIFTNAGAYIEVSAFEETSGSKFTKWYGSEETTATMPTTGGSLGILLGTGIQKGKVSAELRCNLGGNPIPYNDRTKTYQFLFLVAYNL